MHNVFFCFLFLYNIKSILRAQEKKIYNGNGQFCDMTRGGKGVCCCYPRLALYLFPADKRPDLFLTLFVWEEILHTIDDITNGQPNSFFIKKKLPTLHNAYLETAERPTNNINNHYAGCLSVRWNLSLRPPKIKKKKHTN